MTKKTRTILFSILIILFLVVAPGTIFYSWGYRLDIDSKRVTQTGAFYFKIFPKSVQIYLTPLDSHFFSSGQKKTILKKTDFFFGAVLIENLLPKKYEVEIKKEGFYPWKKTLEIKERQVTDAKNIVLVPENPEISILTKEVEDFFFSPDEKKLILKTTTLPPPDKEKSWALKLLELERNVKSHLITQEDISKTEVSLLDLKFSPNSKRILLKISLGPLKNKKLNEGNNFQYFLMDLGEAPPLLISLDFLKKQEIRDIFFHPLDSQKLFLLKNGYIFEGDLTQKKISQAILENVKSFQVFNQDIYYFLDSGPEAGFLFKTDSSFSKREKINRTPFPLGEDEKYKIYIFSDKIFLQDDQNLYLFNPDSNSFENFFEGTRNLKISPDSKKLVYFSDYEIWILFLKDEFSQPQKSAGEKQFIARFSEKIGEVFWYTSHYLIFNVGDKIKIAEIDDRDKINMVDFLELKEPKIFWVNFFKKLYILSGDNLYSSEMPLP